MIFILTFGLSFQGAVAQMSNPYSQYGNQDYPQVQNEQHQSCRDPNWDSDCMCDQQRRKIAWAKAQGHSLNQFDWSKIQSKQLVIIGDAHGVSNPDAILNLINRSRTDSGKQCALFEMSSDYSSEQFLKLVQEKTGLSETDRLRRYYGKIANGAVALGFKPYMVDDPKNWTGDRLISDFEREVHMTTTIRNLFEAQKCDHAVLIIGKAHIAAQYYQTDNLTERLIRSGISLTRLNPIHAPDAGRRGPNEEWNGICQGQTFTPSEALIFENSGIKNDLVIPGFGPPLSTMTYGGFDFSILFPEPRFEQRPSPPPNSRPDDDSGAVR